MRIIFTPEGFNQHHGGVSRVFVELARQLNGAGHEARIVAGLHINQHLHGDSSVIGAATPDFGKLRSALNTVLCRAIIAFWRDGIIHQTYYSRHHYPRNRPHVLTVFDMVHEIFAETFFAHSNQRRQSRNKAVCCSKTDHICAISQQTKEDLIRFFKVPEDKISVTYLGNPLEGVAPYTSSLIGDKKFILYVGGRAWYKNFRSLLEAFRKSKFLRNDYRIICFGGGPLSDDEIGRIKEWDLSEHVLHRTGDDQTLAGYYSRAAAYVSVSLYEGFGLTLLEAMGLGCPVLCSDRASLPEIAGDAAVYFNPESPEDIRRVLEETLSSRATLARLTNAGAERSLLFSWERCAKETLAVYRRVA
jgi:glycosyltransferase involved in cell wall biosynthesis